MVFPSLKIKQMQSKQIKKKRIYNINIFVKVALIYKLIKYLKIFGYPKSHKVKINGSF